MQRNHPLILLMLLILGVVILRESRTGLATGCERRFSDWIARNAAVERKEAPLALIEINDASLTNSRKWPLPPLDFAMFLRVGLFFDPSLLAIEPVMEWPQAKGDGAAEQAQQILHENVLRAPKLLLGAELGVPLDPDLLPPFQSVPVLRHVSGDKSRLLQFPIIQRQPLEDLRLSAQIGFTNLLSLESPARRVPLVFLYCGQVVPSFVLQSAMLWLKLTPEEIEVQPGSFVKLGDKMEIPIDEAGMMNVDTSSRFLRMGLEDLILVVSQIEAQQKPMVAPETLKGKLLLLARTDSGSRSLLFPSGKHGSSGELFAAAIATIQNGSFAQRAPLWVDLLLIAGVLALSRGFGRMSTAGVIFTALLASTVYVMGALSLYSVALIWLPGVLPFGLLGFALLFRQFTPPEPARAV